MAPNYIVDFVEPILKKIYKNYFVIYCLVCEPNYHHHQSHSRLSIPGHLRSPWVSKVTYVLIYGN